MDIFELLQHQSPIRKKDNGWVVFLCPFCEDDTGHLHLNKKKNFWHCFKCAEKGKIDLSTSLLEEYNFKIEDNQDLGAYTFDDVMSTYTFTNLLKCNSISSEMILDEMLFRGLNEEDIVNFNVSTSDTYPFDGRAVIFWYPNGIDRSSPRYLVARRVTSGPPKYMNPVVNKDFVWTSFDIDNPPKRMALVEGFFDGYNVSKVCPSGALLGKTLNSAQVNFLYDLRDKGLQEIVILLDKAGIHKFNLKGKRIHNETDATMRLYSQLKDFFVVKPKFLEYGGDPGSADLNYLEDLIHG